MGDSTALSFRLGIIPLLIAAAFSLHEIDDALYLYVSSHLPSSPPPCPPDEVFKDCFGNCSDCDRRGMCLMAECAKGCDCRYNYARLEPGGPCQHVARCPARECGENEVFRACGPVCETCFGMRCRLLHCEHKCYCKEGFLRTFGRKCVPQEDCPIRKRCFRNEERRAESRAYEYCLRDESSSNDTDTRERCYCKEGHSRSVAGLCVTDETCGDAVWCQGEEVFRFCPPRCNVTCHSFGDPDCEEDGLCYPGCFCPDGLLFLGTDRKCVPLHQCPPGSNPFVPTAASTSPSLPEAIPSTTLPWTQLQEDTGMSSARTSGELQTTASTSKSTVEDDAIPETTPGPAFAPSTNPDRKTTPREEMTTPTTTGKATTLVVPEDVDGEENE